MANKTNEFLAIVCATGRILRSVARFAFLRAQVIVLRARAAWLVRFVIPAQVRQMDKWRALVMALPTDEALALVARMKDVLSGSPFLAEKAKVDGCLELDKLAAERQGGA